MLLYGMLRKQEMKSGTFNLDTLRYSPALLRNFIILSVSVFFLFFSANAFAEYDVEFTPEETKWIQDHQVLNIVVNSAPYPVITWGDSRDKLPPDPPPPLPDFEGDPPRHIGNPPQHGLRENYLPLQKVTDQKKLNARGVALDYLAEITKITGIRFNINYRAESNFRAMAVAVSSGRADIMPSFLLHESSGSDNRSEGLYLTDTFIIVPSVIVTRLDVPYIEDLNLLNSMKLAGTAPTGEKLRKAGLDTEFIHASPPDGLMGVATGKYDAFICALSNVSEALLKVSVTNIKISGELPVPSRFAMAAGPHVKEFVSIFNKALAAITPETRSDIRSKWFKVSYEQRLVSSIWTKIAITLGVLLLIVSSCVICFFYKGMHRMRTKVAAFDPHLLSVNIDQNTVITDVTKALCNATGFEAGDLIGKPLTVLNCADDKDCDSLSLSLETLKNGKSWNGDVRIVRKDGSELWVEAVISPLRRENDAGKGFTIVYQDISKRKHYEDLAVRDELTGLYNRRQFNMTAPHILRKAEEENKLFALLIMDVDNFKAYNDNYGHPAGDKALASIGKVLRNLFQREEDMVFRLGGEELGLAVTVSDRNEAVDIAEAILQSVRELKIEHRYSQPEILTLSIGMALSASAELDELYRQADTALYRAKEEGKNRLSVSEQQR